MSINDLSYLDKTLQQFESHPYPDIPIEESPKSNVKLLYEGSLVTAYYRRDGSVMTDWENRVMLDVACGTGATTLTMALANPGARIVGIDISPESIKIAEERLRYHKIPNAEFHVLALEELAQLGQKFDYISASEVLYLLPDLTSALETLGAMLKPDGVIRGNLHSYYQRLPYYRCQNLFKRIGLMEDNPEETELAIVREFFEALRDNVDLKVLAWGNHFDKSNDQRLLSNHLLQNDKGFTMPQLLDCLAEADLTLINMVDWRDWDWRKLFKDPENLPTYLAIGLEEASLEEQLCFYELIQPDKRLLDFWCGHPASVNPDPPLWVGQANDQILVHLHPLLKTDALFSEITAVAMVAPLDLGKYFPFLKTGLWSDRTLNSCLLFALWDKPQTLKALIERYLMVAPLDVTSLQARDGEGMAETVRQTVFLYEELGIFLLEGLVP